MQDISKNSFYNHRSFLEVDVNAIIHNGMIAKEIFKNKKIMSILKADCYGHGINGVVSAYEHFSDWYAVATVEEGIKVRKISNKPVLLLGPVPIGLMLTAVENNLTFTVGSVEYAEQLALQMNSVGKSCDCQLKIDTGLNRSGVRWCDEEEPLEQIKKIYSHKCLNFVGTYTHFACGEGMEKWEQDFTELQFERFLKAVDAIKGLGYPVGVCHCCSTGGSLVHPTFQMDMVRLGMMPLGMSYSDESVSKLGLKPVAKWVAYIAQTKHICCGDPVSYGCTFRAQRDMKIALVTCGYADGYRRAYSNKGTALIKGKRINVIGRVAMDYLIVDITDVPDAKIGDEIVLLGVDGQETISAQQLCQLCESVSGEVTCAISSRVPRIYKE